MFSWELFFDVLLDALVDTAKLLPFLFLAYFLLEFLEHRAGGATEKWLKRAGKVGPVAGGLLGLLPQCGFSAAATGLYAGRIISTGTLIAVYLSTSDEMLPILLSKLTSGEVKITEILLLLGIKFFIGVLAGFLIDFASSLFSKKEKDKQETADAPEIHCCNKNHRLIPAALLHTLQIGGFILLFNFVLTLVIELIGVDNLSAVLPKNGILSVLAATLVGLIPNCASSVLLTELYLGNLLGFAPLVAGLLVNAGVGLAVLFRNNKPVKDSFRILGILVGISLFFGIILTLFA